MQHNTPNTVLLKSATKMSLNDRFSAYRKNAENTAGAMRQRMQQINQQTSKNWRLIQQMENRPSVIAALKLKKRSLKQRLGQIPRTNVKARLSLGNFRGRGMLGGTPRYRGIGRLNLRGNRNRGGGSMGGRNSRLQSSNSSLMGSHWSLSSASQLQGRLGNARGNKQQQWKVGWGNNRNNPGGNRLRDTRNHLGQGGRDFRRVRGGFRPQMRGNFRGQGQYRRKNSFQQVGARRGAFANNRRGGAFGGRRGTGNLQQQLRSKQALDSELDEYMSRTRGNLDMELDSYMAQAQAE